MWIRNCTESAPQAYDTEDLHISVYGENGFIAFSKVTEEYVLVSSCTSDIKRLKEMRLIEYKGRYLRW